MSKTRERRIINEATPGSRQQIEFLAFSRSGEGREFRRLNPGTDAAFEESDFLVIKSTDVSNYEIRSYNGLLLLPFQVNNQHPEYKDETVAVFEMKVLNGTDDDRESDGDIVITNPQNPHP